MVAKWGDLLSNPAGPGALITSYLSIGDVAKLGTTATGPNKMVKDLIDVALLKIEGLGEAKFRSICCEACILPSDKPVVKLQKILKYEARYLRAIGQGSEAKKLKVGTEIGGRIYEIEKAKEKRQNLAAKEIVKKVSDAAIKARACPAVMKLHDAIKAKEAELGVEELTGEQFNEVLTVFIGDGREVVGVISELELEVLAKADPEFFKSHLGMIQTHSHGNCNPLFRLMANRENIDRFGQISGWIRDNEGFEEGTTWQDFSPVALCVMIKRHREEDSHELYSFLETFSTHYGSGRGIHKASIENMEAMIELSMNQSDELKVSVFGAAMHLLASMPNEYLDKWLPMAARNPHAILFDLQNRTQVFARHFATFGPTEYDPWYKKEPAEMEARLRGSLLQAAPVSQAFSALERAGVKQETLEKIPTNVLAITVSEAINHGRSSQLLELLALSQSGGAEEFVNRLGTLDVESQLNILSLHGQEPYVRAYLTLRAMYTHPSRCCWRRPKTLDRALAKVVPLFVKHGWGNIGEFIEIVNKYGEGKVRQAFEVIDMKDIPFIKEGEEGKRLIDVVSAVIKHEKTLKKHPERWIGIARSFS